jgi:hypothetical protein
MYRPFTGITWAANTDIEDSTLAPAKGARARLNFSGLSGMIGFQLAVNDPNKK